MRKYIIIIISFVVMIGVVLSAVLLPKYIKNKKHSELVSALLSAKFDEYYSENDRFVNLPFMMVALEYESDNVSRFQVTYTTNKEIPQYDQIEREYDAEKYDYVCAHIQVMTKAIDGSKIPEYSENFIFSIDKKSKSIRPFAVASQNKNWKLTKTDDPSKVIRHLYETIELFMKYCG